MKPKLLTLLALVITLITSPSTSTLAAPASPSWTSTVATSGFAALHGIAIDSLGDIYIVNYFDSQIQKVTFDTNGDPTTATLDVGPLNLPTGIAIDSDDKLYITDAGNSQVQRVTFDSNGNPTSTTVAGGSGSNQLTNPYGLAVDSNSDLYIADQSNNRIRKVTFDTNGNPATTTTLNAGPLSAPLNLAVDGNDNLYINDRGNNRIQKVTFDTNGNPTTTTVAGGNGFGSGVDQLENPFDVAVDSNGNLYIADKNNNRIQKVTFDTNGNPTNTSTLNTGPLTSPRSLGFADDDTLYIADQLGNRIQKITPDRTDPTSINTTTAPRVGATKTVSFTCADTGGSEVDACTATLNGQPVSNGDPLNTTKRGTQALVVTATDNSGNTSTQTHTITVHGKRELTGDYTNTDGPAGSIARLYMATFKRAPEGEGFTFWQTSHNNGMTLQKMADHFVTSTEFTSLYGNTTNTEFINLMYLNVMNRTADTEGHAFWLNQLEGGMTQARMLLMLSESPEFKGLTYTS